MSDYLNLSATIRILEIRGTRSKADFWKDIEIGDEIVVITEAKYIGRGSQIYTLINVTQNLKGNTTGGMLNNVLLKYKWRYE